MTALSARDDVLMALMSGRALSDIRERAAIAGLVYAGNHGLEISPPDSPCLFASGFPRASSTFFENSDLVPSRPKKYSPL